MNRIREWFSSLIHPQKDIKKLMYLLLRDPIRCKYHSLISGSKNCYLAAIAECEGICDNYNEISRRIKNEEI